MTDLRALLLCARRNGGRLTGAYARGDQRPDSPIEIYVPVRCWRAFTHEIIGLGVSWMTPRWQQLVVTDFDVPVEFSATTPQQHGVPKTATVCDLEFKTW